MTPAKCNGILSHTGSLYHLIGVHEKPFFFFKNIHLFLRSFRWGEGFYINTCLRTSSKYEHFCPRKFWIHKMYIVNRYLQEIQQLEEEKGNSIKSCQADKIFYFILCSLFFGFAAYRSETNREVTLLTKAPTLRLWGGLSDLSVSKSHTSLSSSTTIPCI